MCLCTQSRQCYVPTKLLISMTTSFPPSFMLSILRLARWRRGLRETACLPCPFLITSATQHSLPSEPTHALPRGNKHHLASFTYVKHGHVSCCCPIISHPNSPSLVQWCFPFDNTCMCLGVSGPSESKSPVSSSFPLPYATVITSQNN